MAEGNGWIVEKEHFDKRLGNVELSVNGLYGTVNEIRTNVAVLVAKSQSGSNWTERIFYGAVYFLMIAIGLLGCAAILVMRQVLEKL